MKKVEKLKPIIGTGETPTRNIQREYESLNLNSLMGEPLIQGRYAYTPTKCPGGNDEICWTQRNQNSAWIQDGVYNCSLGQWDWFRNA